MRVVLILSLASVLLVSVALAAPSWVEQPAYDPAEDINKRGMEIFESFMDWKRSLPADSDQSFLAFQRSLQQREQLSADIEDGPETPLTGEKQQRDSLADNVEEEQVSEPDLQKIARASKISPDNVKERYQQWLKKLPKGRNSSFKAFLDWLDDQDDHDDHDDRYDRYDRDHDDDDDRYDHDEPDDADDFGLTNDEFEELYRTWLSKNSAGEDLSYRAFVRWMQKNNGPEFDKDGTRRRITYIRWGSKIGEYYKDRYARENYVNNERQLAEVQQFPSEEQQPAINQREEAAADLEGGQENQQRDSLVEEQASEPDLQKIARASKLSPDNLKEQYQQWLKKLSKGRNSSFKAFLDWLDDRDDHDHDDHDDDDDRYDHDEPDDADDFGLTNDEFEELYRIWLSKNSAGEDLSYRAFVRWMQKNNGPEFDEDGTRRRITYIRWGSKIGEYYKDRYARENDGNNERQLAEVQQFPGEEQQPAINQREEAAGYEYGGLVGENIEREWQEPIAAAYDGQNAVGYEFQRDMERRQGEEREGFAPARFARAEPQPQEGSSPVPVEEAKPQEEQTPLPFVETEPNDTNGGYSCETNNPCNIENIVNTQFYFATTSTDKYIQCDAWGGCHTLTCDDGLAWDDTIKMCGLRT